MEIRRDADWLVRAAFFVPPRRGAGEGRAGAEPRCSTVCVPFLATSCFETSTMAFQAVADAANRPRTALEGHRT